MAERPGGQIERCPICGKPFLETVARRNHETTAHPDQP